MKTVKLPEIINRLWVEQNPPEFFCKERALRFDFTTVTTIDSVGIAFFSTIQKKMRQRGESVVFENIDDALKKNISTAGVDVDAITITSSVGFFEGIGSSTIKAFETLQDALSVLVEMIYWGSFGMLRSRDMRKGVLGEQMYQLGFRATGIVFLMSFLIGTVLSVQAVMQLRQFGADVFLVSMVTWSMVREMGPLMTAIILAGRSGSATTAEIATMSVQEEIDALRTMGINHIQFIVVPKFWAATITMPVLTLISIAAGIFGGFIVAVFMVGLTPSLFWSEMVKNIFIKDFVISFFKSIVFSWLIIWIGVYFGFRVKGGAEEVGRETTASVVAAIFIIILADALFSFIYNIKF